MTVRERILAIKLLEMQKKQSAFMKKIGIEVKLEDKSKNKRKMIGEKNGN